jgi:hypothetical protein
VLRILEDMAAGRQDLVTEMRQDIAGLAEALARPDGAREALGDGARRRGTQRIAASIWPGFVDAITALVLVLFFVLSIFMIVQFVLRDTITGQDAEIDTLAREIASLADALGLAAAESARQETLIATLTGDLESAEARIANFETQVAALIARNMELTDEVETAQAAAALSDEEARRAEAEAAALLARAETLDAELSEARAAVASGEEAAALAEARRGRSRRWWRACGSSRRSRPTRSPRRRRSGPRSRRRSTRRRPRGSPRRRRRRCCASGCGIRRRSSRR